MILLTWFGIWYKIDIDMNDYFVYQQTELSQNLIDIYFPLISRISKFNGHLVIGLVQIYMKRDFYA